MARIEVVPVVVMGILSQGRIGTPRQAVRGLPSTRVVSG
jgi:hypothetical protein